MSDYARANSGGATHFGDKDVLTTGDANKVIVGGQFDNEFEAIVTAIASKYDVSNLASQVQAESGTNPTALMTPLRAEQHVVAYNADNGGMLVDIHALADPAADTILGWDDSANAIISFTLHASILHAGTEISVDHDAATNFVADEHILHAGVSVIAGAGMTGGGTISASRTLNVIGGDGITANANDIAISATVAGAGLTHSSGVLAVVGDASITVTADALGLATGVAGDGLSLTTGVLAVKANQGLELSGDNVTIADQSVSATVPIKLTAGTLGWDSSSITELVGSGVSQSADGFLLDDAGVLKVVPYDQMAILTASQDAAQTFAITDANTLQILTGSTNRIWTIPTNASVAFQIGTVILLQNTGTGDLTITAIAGVVLDSVFHAAAADNQSDRVLDGGTAALIKTATNTWALSGDIATS